ncbi:helix-turn-helix domain-containing protein [Paraburkholderia silviterrae]|uniref:helix-turn-helix domain-containing protein n=1 Tax=Paraburkholderia silviterrae TaxID=2528715 RepID=UPI001F0F03E3|nr:helix-turn-helix domain-containing protein [Paraburkholderia silviterrae]
MTEKALSLKEAAALLGVCYSTLYTHKEEMGFFKVGGQWRIWPDKLKGATEYNPDRPARTEPRSEKCQSVSAKAPTFGTLISARQAAAEFDKVLEQVTGRKRKNCTTS